MASSFPILTDPNLFQARKRRVLDAPVQEPNGVIPPAQRLTAPAEVPVETVQPSTRIAEPLPQASHALQSFSRAETGEAYPELPAARLLPPQAIATTQGMERQRIASTGTPEQQRGLVNNDLRATYGDAIADQLVDGPAVERLRASHEPDTTRHGFGNKLVHVLSGIGKGLVLGGVGGAVLGGISPGTVDRAIYRGIERPRLEADAERERGMQAQRLGELGNVANLTGQLPGGEPTEATRHRFTQEAEIALRNRLADEDRNRSLADRERRTGGYLSHLENIKSRDERKQKLSEMNAWLRNIAPYGRISDADKSDFARRYGFELPEGFDPQRHQLYDDGQGVSVIGLATGDVDRLAGVPSAKGAQIAATKANVGANIASREREGAAKRGVQVSEGALNRDAANQRASSRGGRNTYRQRAQAGEAQPSTPAPTKRRLTQADVKAYADRYYKGDVEKARADLGARPNYELP